MRRKTLLNNRHYSGPDPGNVGSAGLGVVHSNFAGLNHVNANRPDTTIAVGTTHVVQMVNRQIAIFERIDGVVEDESLQLKLQQNLGNRFGEPPGFFEKSQSTTSLGGNEVNMVDPRCIYDHFANRFVVMCLELSVLPDSFLESHINIAVSDDDNPEGIWYQYRLESTFVLGTEIVYPDYPSLGFDAQGYYISGNLITLRDPMAILYRTIDKTPMLNNQELTTNDTADVMDTQLLLGARMAHTFGSNHSPYAAVLDSSANEVEIVALDDPFNNLTIVKHPVAVSPYQNSPESIPNTSSNNIVYNRLSFQVLNAQFRNGRLYTSHTIDKGGRAVVRWYEFNVGDWPDSSAPVPSLVQCGDIDIAGEHTYFPAIYSNFLGDVAIFFAKSSSDDQTGFVSVNCVARKPEDPAGELGTPVQIAVSTNGINDMGDYFGLAVDPKDGITFWGTGETYATNPLWTTVISKFPALSLVGDVDCNGIVDLLDVTPLVNLINTGGYSPKADINQDGSVNLLDIDLFVELLLSGQD